MIRLEIKNYNIIINREGVKISALSSGKIDKYENLTGKEISLSNQKQIIEQARFTYSPLGKTLEKQRLKIKQKIKAIKSRGKKLVESNSLV